MPPAIRRSGRKRAHIPKPIFKPRRDPRTVPVEELPGPLQCKADATGQPYDADADAENVPPANIVTPSPPAARRLRASCGRGQLVAAGVEVPPPRAHRVPAAAVPYAVAHSAEAEHAAVPRRHSASPADSPEDLAPPSHAPPVGASVGDAPGAEVPPLVVADGGAAAAASDRPDAVAAPVEELPAAHTERPPPHGPPTFKVPGGSGTKPKMTRKGVAQGFAETITRYKGTTTSQGGRPAHGVAREVELRPYHELNEHERGLLIGGITDVLSSGDATVLQRYSYLPELMAALPEHSQSAIAEALVKAAPDAFVKALANSDNETVKHVIKAVGTEVLRVDPLDAAVLYLESGLAKHTWEKVVKILNLNVPSATKHGKGGLLPTYKTVQKTLRAKGLTLDNVVVVDMREAIESMGALSEDGEVINLALDDDDDDAEEQTPASAPAASEEKVPEEWAARIQACLEKHLGPDFILIKNLIPHVWEAILKRGAVTIVLAMDNSSYPRFDGRMRKVETGTSKLLLPLVDGAQQSPHLASILFLVDGEETYAALKVMLEQLKELFKTTVRLDPALVEGLSEEAAATPAAQTLELQVEWLLSSDAKLLTMVLGHGGAGCSCACPFCEWMRSGSKRVHAARTKEGMERQAQLSELYARPLISATQKVQKAKADVKHVEGRVASQGILDAAQAALAAAVQERTETLSAVKAAIVAAGEHEPAVEGATPTLRDLVNDAATFQAAGVAARHVQLISSIDDRYSVPLEILADLRRVGEDIFDAKKRASALRAGALPEAEKARDAAVAAHKRNSDPPGPVQLLRRVQDADRELEDVLAKIAEEEAMQLDAQAVYEQAIADLNEEYGLVVVRSTGTKRTPQIGLPNARIEDLEITTLVKLLSASLAGVQQISLVKDVLSLDAIFLEPLHLLIQTGNSWYEAVRNALQYALTAEGHVRDVQQNRPNAWPRASSGSRQKTEWTGAGYDFEALVYAVTGVYKPITKFHGRQVPKIYAARDEIWRRLQPAFERLETSDVPAFRELPAKIKAVWEHLSAVHAAVEHDSPELIPLARHVSELRRAQEWFFEHDMAPLRTTEKFYDHATDAHLLDQMQRLEAKDMSLALVGSKHLEHLNAPVKGTLKKLRGGGAPKDPHANKPVVQAKNKLYGYLKAKRMQLFAEYAKQPRSTAGRRGFIVAHRGGDHEARPTKRQRTGRGQN